MPSNRLIVLAIPAVFVFLWSTGFVGAKYAMGDAEPYTFLSLRFFLAFVLLVIIGVFTRSHWPRDWRPYAHLAMVGFLIHGLYLGGVFAAVYHGLPAGISAVIVGLHPLLTAVIAAGWLKETVSRQNVVGLVIAFVGLILVLGGDGLLGADATTYGVILCFGGLLGISLGSLYQKRFCGSFDLVSGTSIQYLAAAALLAIPAFAIETREITWTAQVIGAMVWLLIALSVVAVLLLMYMIRHGEANRVASLFFLVPALTPLETWILFDEALSALAICGIILCMLGVYLARRTES
ncbi:MAG: DMT family transporter [Pseudomonadota bacterium]